MPRTSYVIYGTESRILMWGPLLKNYKEFQESGNRSLNQMQSLLSCVTEQNTHTHNAGPGYARTKVPWAQLTLVSMFWNSHMNIFKKKPSLSDQKHHTHDQWASSMQRPFLILLAMTIHLQGAKPTHQCFPVNNLAKRKLKNQDSTPQNPRTPSTKQIHHFKSKCKGVILMLPIQYA